MHQYMVVCSDADSMWACCCEYVDGRVCACTVCVHDGTDNHQHTSERRDASIVLVLVFLSDD
jgi:hypothetical protein